MTRHSKGLEGIFRHPDMAFHGIIRHNKAKHKQRINIDINAMHKKQGMGRHEIAQENV